jgi:serine/threonine-protein kinase HipA
MNRLDVYLHSERVGHLERREQGRLHFTYEPDWVDRAGPALSHSLPLRPEPFDDAACRPFFAGLLPEGEFLRAVARSFGVSATNPFAVLTAIGGECAGAVSLAPEGASPPRMGPPKWLNARELADLIDELPRRPLLAGDPDEGLRLSLAGAQDKLPVIYAGGRVGITRGDPPSTHIIKLPSERFDDMTANEAFCLALARRATLNAVDADARIASRGAFETHPDDREYLLVARYDREMDEDGTRRIHQEDLCQALGFVPELKYEADGGPGVAACARHLREHSAAPAVDILGLVDALIFNFIVGNHDAHSKNLSLILQGPLSPRLAPLYDLISTTAYEGLSRKMAMKLGGEYRPAYVRGRHLERLAGDLEMPPSALRRRAAALSGRVEEAMGPALEDIPSEFAARPILERVRAQTRTGIKRLREAIGDR